jgi:iron(III) transport system ATP-binding protein
MNDAFLRCYGVVKRFGLVRAVDGVDFDVQRGQTMALLGASGSGKTTLLRLIAGFEVPDAGEITLRGRILSDRSTFVPPEKRRIGMVFQDYALFPHLDVAANVGFGVRGRGDRKRHVEELLSLVGLEGLGKRMPHELSGGQQQRVALARTLAAEPDLVLLDEPFSNLDPGMRARVRVEVRRILESLGTTAVFVTHDQEEALSIAERVAVMLEGRIVQVGRPADVYRVPASKAVAEFLGDANILAGEAAAGSVVTALGTAPAPGDHTGSVQVLIRPEDLALDADAGVTAVVIAREYYGHDQMITVQLAEGSVIKVRDLVGRDVSRGDRVGVTLRGEVVVFDG